MDVAGQTVSVSALLALGIVVGLVAGMFGVGGGFMLTPMLSVVLGSPITLITVVLYVRLTPPDVAPVAQEDGG